MRSRGTTIRLLLLTTALAPLAGCLQLHLRVRLNTDGSATVYENVRFSRRLLDLGGKQDTELKIAPLLEKAAVGERMKHMGKGIKLLSHKVVEVEKGARESQSVFQIADVRELKYVSPFMAYADYKANNVLQVRMAPLYKSNNYVGVAGQMGVGFRLLKRPQNHPRRDEKAPKPKGPPPRQQQILRDLKPVFRDMLAEFKLRLTFECYAPISATGFGWRDRRAGTNIVDLINVTDHDLDLYGDAFFANEEIMLDLLRGDLGSANIVNTVQHFRDNKTVPLFLPFGSANRWWHPNDGIFFRPSRQLFDKYFKGKKIDFDRWRSTGKNIRPANFKEVGFDPKVHKIGTQTKSPAPGKPGAGPGKTGGAKTSTTKPAPKKKG